MNNQIFENWGLSPQIISAIKEMGYTQPTQVQEACIPVLLGDSQDMVALARTGTGKTAAFGIPLIEKIDPQGGIQSLVLCPTRELASQVAQNLRLIGKNKNVKVQTILGGESYKRQIEGLRQNPQIIVSTPGRLVDLMEQDVVDMSSVEFLILDEADEMLSFGFQDALEFICKSFKDSLKSTWLFSATMSDSVRKLASKYLRNPTQISLVRDSVPNRIESFVAVVYEEDKEDALALLIKNEPQFYGIIFAQTKAQVSHLEIKLKNMGLKVESIHGDKVQADRRKVIDRLKRKDTQILVATDVAARGLDIQDLTHVVNFELPWDVETYTHRIGRTARAGKSGIAWTLVKPKEAHSLRKFEKALKFEFKPLKIPTVEDVKLKQIQTWLEGVASIPLSEQKVSFFKNIFSKLKGVSIPDDEKSLSFLIQVLDYLKIGKEFKPIQPRSFDYKASQEPQDSFSGDRRRPSRNRRQDRRDGGRRSDNFDNERSFSGKKKKNFRKGKKFGRPSRT